MQAAANAFQEHLGPLPTVTHAESEHAGGTMRALAWFGSKDVRIVDAPIPAVTEPDDVIIRVTASTIWREYHGEIMTMQRGDILGHEFMGIVDKIGPGVKNLFPGQRVVASFQIACGDCEFCKKNLSSMCDRTNDSSLQKAMYGTTDAGFFGYSHFTGGYAGGQAEYVRVPKGNVNLLPIPDNGDTVAIWGLGPIGLLVAHWAKFKGASRVIGIDRVPERLAFAQEKLNIDTINFSEHKDVPKRIREIVGEKGVDTIGHKIQKFLMLETDAPETINEMLIAVRKMGRVGLIAAYAGYANQVNVGALMEKGIRLIGNGQAPVHKYWHEIMQYIQDGQVDPTFVVTHRVPLEDMPGIRTAGVEKVIVDTKFSESEGVRGKGCPPLTRTQTGPPQEANLN
ncbi:GroES-like protein [Coprinellus micaceus]|uniref:GroES-like protein n=1 Tax=Coprinellus micaceus TaxID=71717 RepID=A0A4Y7SV75_COPMI|nr:GroES-like protein [Coprinellus micaceus]